MAQQRGIRSRATKHHVFPKVILEAVRKGVGAVFGGSCEVECHQGAPPPEAACKGVMGTIYFTGELSWSIRLAFPIVVAEALVKQFAGFDVTGVEMGDVVGEMANVLAGMVNAILDENQIKTEISLPLVATGHDLRQSGVSKDGATQMDYQTGDGGFWLRLVPANTGIVFYRRAGA
jgi:CheY-specific phosphatase CheX